MTLQPPRSASGTTNSPKSAFVLCPALMAWIAPQAPPLAHGGVFAAYAYALAVAQHRVAEEELSRPYPLRPSLN